MQRVIISRHGGPEVLVIDDVPMPQPKPTEVRIRVSTAGVAFADLLRRRGALPGDPKLPFTPGFDVVGVVDQLGSGVQGVRLGDRVAALTGVGGYAEQVCVQAGQLIAVPEGVSDVDAVAAVLNYGTAYQLLHRAAQLVPGHTTLVPGAAGGVGTAMLQLAALQGVRTIGLASARKHALVQSLGATPVDDKAEGVAEAVMALTKGRGVDAAFDAAGGRAMWRSRKMVRRGGRLVIFGLASVVGRDGTARKSQLLTGLASLGLMAVLPGPSVSLYLSEREVIQRLPRFKADVAVVLELIRTGQIKPVIADVLPLASAAQAHTLMESGMATGKVVLQVSHSASASDSSR